MPPSASVQVVTSPTLLNGCLTAPLRQTSKPSRNTKTLSRATNKALNSEQHLAFQFSCLWRSGSIVAVEIFVVGHPQSHSPLASRSFTSPDFFIDLPHANLTYLTAARLQCTALLCEPISDSRYCILQRRTADTHTHTPLSPERAACLPACHSNLVVVRRLCTSRPRTCCPPSTATTICCCNSRYTLPRPSGPVIADSPYLSSG